MLQLESYKEFKDNFDLLIEKYEQIKIELQLQQMENFELTKLVKEQNEQLTHFHNREKITKLVDAVVSESDDKKELRSRINQYIKLIDECIARLEV